MPEATWIPVYIIERNTSWGWCPLEDKWLPLRNFTGEGAHENALAALNEYRDDRPGETYRLIKVEVLD